MRTSVALLLVLSLGLALRAADAKEELDKLQGTWVRVSAEVDGKKVPADEAKKETLVIKGDDYTATVEGKPRKGTLKVDPTRSPKQLDLIPAEGPNKGKVLPGIYELDGDTFRYCIATKGDDRPTEFSSKPGSGHRVYVNRREKP
jgi:uncharacterized protein (TIGR03067 family)